MDEVNLAMVSVRADTRGFLSDVASMRDALESGLGGSAARAGGLVEQALLKAARTGKLSFEDLKATALRVMDQIAAAALRNAVRSLIGDVASTLAPTGLGAGLGVASAGGGQPGRATGGPVAPGRGYLVGERGPELFVPAATGRIETLAPAAAREVRVSITIHAGRSEPAAALRQSSRQVAQAVRAALN